MHFEVRCHNRGAGQEQLPLHPRQQPLQPEVLLRPLALVSSPSPPPTEALAMFANQGTSYPRHPLFAWSLSQTPLRISATVPMQLKRLNATHAMTLIFTLNLSRLFVDFHNFSRWAFLLLFSAFGVVYRAARMTVPGFSR